MKREFSDESRFKKGDVTQSKNADVARWGRVAGERYLKERELVAGWSSSDTNEYLAENGPVISGPIGGVNAKFQYQKRILKELEDLKQKTIDYLRTAICEGDSESIRKLAEVIEVQQTIASPDALLLLTVVCPAAYSPGHRFVFKELRAEFAQMVGEKVPFTEAFEKRLRRLIKALGIPLLKAPRKPDNKF